MLAQSPGSHAEKCQCPRFGFPAPFGPRNPVTSRGETVVVTIETGRPMASVPGAPVGTNDWDSDVHMHLPSTSRLLRAAGLRVHELNTGPYGDVYRWRTNTDDNDPITDGLGKDHPQPWQSWVQEVERTGASSISLSRCSAAAQPATGSLR